MVRAGSCLKARCLKCKNLLEIPCPKESLKYPCGLLRTIPVPESLLSLAALLSGEPGDIELIKYDYARFSCVKCFLFIKLESESLHVPYVVLVMSLDGVENHRQDPSGGS